jgi:hypothetical protein
MADKEPGASDVMAEMHRQDIYKNKSFRQKAYDFGEALAGIPPERRPSHYEGIADTSKRYKEHR